MNRFHSIIRQNVNNIAPNSVHSKYHDFAVVLNKTSVHIFNRFDIFSIVGSTADFIMKEKYD